MAVTSHIYPYAQSLILANTPRINLTTDSLKMLLMTTAAATWTATQWAYQFVTAVTTAYTEVAASGGYSTGGVALAGAAIAAGGTTQSYKLTCTSPISFGATTTITALSALVYDTTIGSAYSSYPAVAIIDFGASVISTGGPWTYTIDATNGLCYWSSS